MSEPRCKGLVPPRWYKPEPTRCKLPAWKDGWCRRHHPANRGQKGTVRGQLESARRSLASAETKVNHWKRRITELEKELARYDAFVGQNAELSTGGH